MKDSVGASAAPPPEKVPAFINTAAGNADDALAVLRGDRRVLLHETSPAELRQAVTKSVTEGARTVIVAGGDGTLSTAAGCVANTDTTLCVLRSGTRNHFARRLGIPVDPQNALELAFSGDVRKIDVGWVNETLFLNTSVVGLYVDYVRRRERLKRRIGRPPASVAAAVRSFFTLRDHHVELEIEGVRRTCKSMLFFAAVGERAFHVPVLGELKESGRRGLHVVAVQPGSRARLLMAAVRIAARGVRPWPAGDQPDSFVVGSCELFLARPIVRAALDGEIVKLQTPLTYRFERDAISIRVPSEC